MNKSKIVFWNIFWDSKKKILYFLTPHLVRKYKLNGAQQLLARGNEAWQILVPNANELRNLVLCILSTSSCLLCKTDKSNDDKCLYFVPNVLHTRYAYIY